MRILGITRASLLVVPLLILACSKPVDLPVTNLENSDPMVAGFIESTSRAVVNNPGSVDAWNDLGRTYYANGFPEEASTVFTESLRLDPNQARTLYLRGLARRNLYLLEDSLADIEAALKQMPNIPHLSWRAAWIAMELGELARARALVDSAIELAPDDQNSLRVSARLHLETGTPGEGLDLLEPLLEQNPADRDVLWLRVRLLRSAGRHEEAKRLADVVGTKSPVYSDPWALWAMTRKTGQTVETRRVLNLSAKGNLKAATQILNRLERHFPDVRGIELLRGILIRRRGDSEESLLHFESLCSEYPDWAAPHQQIATTLLARKMGGVQLSIEEESRLREVLEEAVELNPDLTTARAQLAAALASDQQWEGVAENLEVCVEQQPLEIAHRINLAAALLQSDKPGESLGILDDSLFLMRDIPVQAMIIRIRALIKLERTEEAEVVLELFRQNFPGHPSIPRLELSLGNQGP